MYLINYECGNDSLVMVLMIYLELFYGEIMK